jgi:hypothetical protein
VSSGIKNRRLILGAFGIAQGVVRAKRDVDDLSCVAIEVAK